jgi:hypothetical protein
MKKAYHKIRKLENSKGKLKGEKDEHTNSIGISVTSMFSLTYGHILKFFLKTFIIKSKCYKY